jgi:PAS domain S-box-containing protein
VSSGPLWQLAATSQEIGSAPTLEDLLQTITDRVREIIGAHQSVVSTTVREDGSQSITAVSLSDRYAPWRDYDVPPRGVGVVRLVLEENRVMRLTQAELEAHPAWTGFGAEASRHPPMRGWLAAPLVARDGRTLGLIQLSDPNEGEFTAADEAVLVQVARMASLAIERAHAEEAARRVDARLRAALDSLSQGVAMWDADGRLLGANPRCREILGWRAGDVPARDDDECWRAVDEDGAPVAPGDTPTAAARRTGRAVPERVLGLTRPDGSRVWVSASASPVPAAGRDEPDSVLLSFSDVTARVQAERAVREQHLQLQALNAGLERRVRERHTELRETVGELEAFTSSVSHDLRAPLRAIRGFADMLADELDGHASPVAAHYLGRVREGARTMSALIDALLYLSRAGRRPIERRTVDATALVRDVVRRMQEGDGAPAARVEVAELPACEADPVLLRQVFANLLSNAVKFSDAGTGRVRVSGTVEAGVPVFSVEDDGVGFDMGDAERMFAVFERLPGGAGVEGAGVGLAIVQRIVQRHGGRAWAEGAPGRGARVSFTLPAAPPAEEPGRH